MGRAERRDEVSFGEHVRIGIERYAQPDPSGDWRSPLFDFLRWVKAHPDARELRARDAFENIESVLVNWRTSSLEDSWARWLGVDYDDAEAEVMSVWPRIRYVDGEQPLDKAMLQAERRPVRVPESVMQDRPKRYEAFVGLCFWLQQDVGDSNIYLPCEAVGEVMGVTPITISRYRQFAVEDGYLREVKAHAFRSAGGSKATEFQVDFKRIPCPR